MTTLQKRAARLKEITERLAEVERSLRAVVLSTSLPSVQRLKREHVELTAERNRLEKRLR